MRKELTFNVKRTINTIDLGYGVSVYSDSVQIGNESFSNTEGITENENLGVNGLEKIKANNHYFLFTTDEVEKLRTNPSFEFLQKKNPYQILENEKNSEYIPAIYDSYSGRYQKLNGEYFPKAMSFDYCCELIDNSKFDLDRLKTYLEQYPDKFRNIKKYEIPYYNADEFHDTALYFVWTPTEQEYNEYLQLLNDVHDSFKQKAITFLNLDQFRI